MIEYHDVAEPQVAEEAIFNFIVKDTQLPVLKLDDLSALLKVQTLVLSGLGLEFLYTFQFAHIPHLFQLDLSRNHLNRLPTGIFSANKRLGQIDLSHNQLVDLPKNLVAGLGGINELKLSHNALTSFDLEFFDVKASSPSRFRILDLSYNQLKDFDPKYCELIQNDSSSTNPGKIDLTGNPIPQERIEHRANA